MEIIFIASSVTTGAAFVAIGGLSIRYRLFERRGAVPASVLTPISDDWYCAAAERLMALPKDEADAQLAAMGRGVAAGVRSCARATSTALSSPGRGARTGRNGREAWDE